jgi:DNA-binding transcriptional MerR regulator
MNTKQVKELTGLTYGQLNYLVDQVDALKREKKQGKARDFSFRDLVYLKLASVMRSDGMGLPAINEVMSVLDHHWINENPNDAGTLMRLYLEDSDQYCWTWSPNFDEKFDVAKARLPGYLYNVEYYASELSNLDQLELDIMAEEMAVQN